MPPSEQLSVSEAERSQTVAVQEASLLQRHHHPVLDQLQVQTITIKITYNQK